MVDRPVRMEREKSKKGRGLKKHYKFALHILPFHRLTEQEISQTSLIIFFEAVV